SSESSSQAVDGRSCGDSLSAYCANFATTPRGEYLIDVSSHVLPEQLPQPREPLRLRYRGVMALAQPCPADHWAAAGACSIRRVALCHRGSTAPPDESCRPLHGTSR